MENRNGSILVIKKYGSTCSGKFLLMESMLVNGKMVKEMVTEYSIHLMEVCMKVNFRMVKGMAAEYSIHLKEIIMKGNGKMENVMVKEP